VRSRKGHHPLAVERETEATLKASLFHVCQIVAEKGLGYDGVMGRQEVMTYLPRSRAGGDVVEVVLKTVHLKRSQAST
jgi:hypothetical protein